MNTGNKIRKKCQKCGRTFVVPILQDTCTWRTFTTPECGGELELFSADREDSINNLVAIVREIHRLHTFKESELLDAAVDDFGCWSERDATPQEMGWVDSHGLP